MDATQNDERSARLTRRHFFRASGAGVATAVILGAGVRPESAQAAALPGGAGTASGASLIARGSLLALDAHAFTGLAAQQAATPAGVRILPFSFAKFLAGARFDLRIEASGVDPANAQIEISVSGPNGPEPLLQGEPVRSSQAPDSLEVTYRGLSYDRPGEYTISATATSGAMVLEANVLHEVVVAGGAGPRAKNVIFFLGDGMGEAPITAARLMSMGMTRGKYHGLLEMDRMDYRGIVMTSGADSIATDSANSMSAYMTGHKSWVNAMGVYVGNNPNPNEQPWVENIAELAKRARGMSVGVVTTAEVQDATPAAVWAHTRRRSEYMTIMDQALTPNQAPDVLMGGGLASLLPQSETGSRRKDDRDLRQEFSDQGYAWAGSRAELAGVMSGGAPDKLVALFHTGNMNVYLDRQHRKNPQVLGRFDDQPTLMEMTAAALSVLEKNANGFVLVVEGASIDKMEHPLDGPRAAYDTIEMDKALGVAKAWAAQRGDTLIVVTADHNHSMSVVGTHDRTRGAGRSGNGVYATAGFPTYIDSDGDGFPDDPDPERGIFFGWSNHPDHRDDFRVDPVFTQPALMDRTAPEGPKAVPNPAKDPDAELQTGNLPMDQTNCVHTVEDVPIVALGPGADRFNSVMDNTEVFFAMMDALGLDART